MAQDALQADLLTVSGLNLDNAAIAGGADVELILKAQDFTQARPESLESE